MADFTTRPGTLDEYVVKENCYEKCSFSKDDVWLDAGGNIGAFSVKYSDRVKEMHTFEPDKENYALLVTNAKNNSARNVKTYNYALVENNDETRKFYLNKKQNKGAHSLYVKRGRDEVEVRCKNFDEMVEQIQPNKMKMDVEGAEYDIMVGSKTLHYFNEIIFEYHRTALKDLDNKKFQQIKTKLQGLGFSVQHKEIKNDWHFMVHCRK